jgi:hypothetical protein
MGQPRFLIVSRPARCAEPAPDDVWHTETVWRLVGANNRSLGQSQGSFGDIPSCQAAIRRLVNRLAQCKPTLHAVDSGQLWVWRLELEGQVLAVSARPYRRQRECQYNLAGFLAGAGTGEPPRSRSGARMLPRARRGGL